MKIEFETYIKRHRSKFDDVEELNVDELWKDFVEKDQPVSNSVKPKFIWYKVAAVGIILIVAVSVLSQHLKLNKDDVIYERLSQRNPGLAEEQEHLVQLISNQGDLIGAIGIDEKQFPELFQELKVLDSMQIDTMKDIDNYQDQKNLYKALLRNYESKARVLELIIREFDKKENESNYEKSIEI